MMMKRGTIVVTVGVCLALGLLSLRMLRRSDPLASLEDPVLSSKYSSAFWMAESRANTRLWSRASALCSEIRDADSRPNCDVVEMVSRKGAPPVAAENRSHQRVAIQPTADDIGNGLTGHGAREVPSGFRHPNQSNTAEKTSK
jgi:hypothetical protein